MLRRLAPVLLALVAACSEPLEGLTSEVTRNNTTSRTLTSG